MGHFQGHSLIIGMSGSGKSTLIKLEIIPAFRKAGYKAAVLDPLGDPDFRADYQTKNSGEFLRYAFANTGHVLIVDESGQAVGRYNTAMQSLATQIRHKGNLSFFSTQGLVQLAPIVRDQCSSLFLFRCSRRNFEMAADEFTQPDILKVPPLGQGEFLFVPKFGEIRRGSIDFAKRVVKYKAGATK